MVGSNSVNNETIKKIINKLEVKDINKRVSEIAVSVHKQLKSENKMIDLADLLIGSTAIAFDLKLATLNLNHFSRIPGINIYKI
jgi:predicted nucleic acid-binding protein